MRIARIDTDEGIVTGTYDDGVVSVDGASYVVGDDAALLAPCEPSTLYCVGRNYEKYLETAGGAAEDHLHWFLKPPAAVHDPERPVPYPSFARELGGAGELAAVIGERCRDVPAERVPDVIRGYTIVNDLDAEDQPEIALRKAFDGAAPLGPWIRTDVDPTDLDMRTTVNGDVRQEGNTAAMVRDPQEIVSTLSRRFTFRPGDVVAFGSPDGPVRLEPGDEVEIWYEGIGTLRNRIDPPR